MPRKPLRPDEPMSKFLLFQRMWQEKYKGEKYLCTMKDMKFAKELCEIDNDEIVRRVNVYFKDDWYGENCRHGLAAFVSNINKFIPAKKEERRGRSIQVCDKCKTEYPSMDMLCPKCYPAKSTKPPSEVLEVLDALGKRLSMPKDTTPTEKHNSQFPERMAELAKMKSGR